MPTTFEVYRTVKRRKGYYAESDIHSYSCSYESGGSFNTVYHGLFELSKYKSISITQDKYFLAKSYRVYWIGNDGTTYETDYVMNQHTTVQVVPNPTISINSDLGVIGDACSIKYRIPDSNPDVAFKITVKLNDVVISEKNNTVDSNYTIDLTDEHLSNLAFNSVNDITIELSTTGGGAFLDKTVTFTKGNTKPTILVNSYNSTSATFTATDADNNLSKIEWYLDDVLKETITTDLTAEKTINYELTDNAIHTLKIVATDAENATAEKVLSISKEIMPLQSDATLQDISTKLIEIGEGFKNGKTSIINTLALKNIEASLNNTLVELSEKIKESFDSSDASVQELQNIITQKNNTITQLNTQLGQRKRWAKGTFDQTKIKNGSTTIPMNLSFVPSIIFVTCGLEFNFTYASAWRCSLKFFTNLVKTNPTALKGNDENFSGVVLASVEGISRNSFVLSLKNLSGNGSTAEISAISGTTFNWTAIE
ncbi:Uncharacterised protein [Clostridioides difficile]|uniref:hypothetical protein n=1 Tax=Clostridioides difficile TaxID=1496 RepID=UPI00097FDA03|nr:hypothetical protein [Clostridioides difficile]MDV9763556.1 hypothetical protein [Clostridioides difficile]SJP48593.1 Uncharacterised protein [Clostridioides difficile]